MNAKELEAAKTLIQIALNEDVATGDVTTDNLVPAETRRKAYMVAKVDGVVAGIPIAEMVFRHLDDSLVWEPQVEEGAKVINGTVLVRFEASYRALLTGERTALNFFQRLSGIATMAAKYADAVKGTQTVILDTRKTLPGFRMLDKYAVKMGGATNHRIGLFDMVMIKDNHIDIAGGITPAVEQIKANVPAGIKIEVETTKLDQVQEALDAGVDIIMLDNMDNETMTKAVQFIQGRAKVEASGNMTIERLKDVAATGVDYISIGALTHSVQAMDISQRIEE